jgi:hypothetical protein
MTDDQEWGEPVCTTDSPLKEWRVGIRWHRLDGPAIEWPDGSTSWYQYGLRHREDGPAIEWYFTDGSLMLRQWYYHDKQIMVKTQEEFEKLIKMKAFW